MEESAVHDHPADMTPEHAGLDNLGPEESLRRYFGPHDAGTLAGFQAILRERWALDGESANLVSALFHANFYRRHEARFHDWDRERLFEHFIDEGAAQNYAPGPFFDPATAAAGARRGDSFADGFMPDDAEDDETTPAEMEAPAVPANIFRDWLDNRRTRPAPTPLFDTAYYLSVNSDVAGSPIEPFTHFMLYGIMESRAPAAGLKRIGNAATYLTLHGLGGYADILSLFPLEQPETLIHAPIWDFLQSFIQADFYKHLYPQLADGDQVQLFSHFLGNGLFAGSRPSIFFNETHYLAELAHRQLPPPPPGVAPFAHWLEVGRIGRVVPTFLFNEDLYLQRYKDIARARAWAFEHFFKYGCREEFRTGSDFFDNQRVGETCTPAASKIFHVNYALVGEPGGLACSAAMAAPDPASPADLHKTSQLEDMAAALRHNLRALEIPAIAKLVARAAEIEPLIMHPAGPRQIQVPGLKHIFMEQVSVAETARRQLQKSHYDLVVLIPHCRISGAARVGGVLTKALAALYPRANMLLIITDLPDFQRPDWFSPDFEVLNLPAIRGGMRVEARMAVLADVLRGIEPRHVINVNSNTGWNLIRTYGRQLSALMQFHTYLFTWDLDARGHKGGYPIQWLQPVFGYLSTVFTDSQALRDELVQRYHLPAAMAERFITLYTPVELPDIMASPMHVRYRRRRGEPLRLLWAGRFDRQKRFDLVVEMARLRPDIEIVAYGKPVLNDFDMDEASLPANIKLMGTYDDLEMLPFEQFDAFLYTSWWDGIPTILLDIGLTGLPVVASIVGGVGEIIDAETGWPVHDVLNPEAYLEVLEDMARDTDEILRRSANLQERLVRINDQQVYRKRLRAALAIGDD